MQAIGKGSSHGKLILVGEHAVVYGTPAIAIPLNQLKVEVNCQSTANSWRKLTTKPPQITLKSALYQGDLQQTTTQLSSIRALVNAFFQALAPSQKVPNSLRIEIKSQLPYERGMGSSAATATALVRALNSFFDAPLQAATSAELIAYEEKLQHGNPSGLDALVVGSQHGYYYQKQHDLTPLTLTLPGFLLIVDSGITGQTSQALKKVASLKTAQPQLWQTQIERIAQLTPTVRAALTATKPTASTQQTFGQALTTNHQTLQQLRVSLPATDRLVQKLLQNGAVGAKLTGGGLGGCVFGYFTTKETAQKAQQQFKEDSWLIKLAPELRRS